jgi:hypothetical protein
MSLVPLIAPKKDASVVKEFQYRECSFCWPLHVANSGDAVGGLSISSTVLPSTSGTLHVKFVPASYDGWGLISSMVWRRGRTPFTYVKLAVYSMYHSEQLIADFSIE